MSGVIKVSEATSIAIHAMVLLAAASNGPIPAATMAKVLHVSTAHLAKVMQRLVRADLVKSTRGPSGGFTLAHPMDQISLLDIYQTIEGNVQETGCLLSKDVCKGSSCLLGHLLHDINLQVLDLLSKHTLADLKDSPLMKAFKKEQAA